MKKNENWLAKDKCLLGVNKHILVKYKHIRQKVI